MFVAARGHPMGSRPPPAVSVSGSTTAGTASFPSIQIVGAGLAGLALACHLRRRGIAYRIFDSRTPSTCGHRYSVALHADAYTSLLNKAVHPRIDPLQLQRAAGIDRHHPKTDDASPSQPEKVYLTDQSFRKFLIDQIGGDEVKWQHKLVAAKPTSNGAETGTLLTFENGTESFASITVDAGGLRSPITSLLLESREKGGTDDDDDNGGVGQREPKILPYATYHGVRQVSLEAFDRQYAKIFNEQARVEVLPIQPGAPFLMLQRVFFPSTSEPKSEEGQNLESHVEVRWTFSRPSLPARHSSTNQPDRSDPLWRPERSQSEAKTIPSKFFEEVGAFLDDRSSSSSSPRLRSSTPAEVEALSNIFSPRTIESDRIMHWLLRTRLLPPSDLRHLTQDGKGVVVIGDSAHGLPILKSSGANLALRDAERLADFVSSASLEEVGSLQQRLSDFYFASSPAVAGTDTTSGEERGKTLYETWLEEIVDCEQTLKNVHRQKEEEHVDDGKARL